MPEKALSAILWDTNSYDGLPLCALSSGTKKAELKGVKIAF
jgi:hypothetical protein